MKLGMRMRNSLMVLGACVALSGYTVGCGDDADDDAPMAGSSGEGGTGGKTTAGKGGSPAAGKGGSPAAGKGGSPAAGKGGSPAAGKGGGGTGGGGEDAGVDAG